MHGGSLFSKFLFLYFSPYERKSKTVLDSGFHGVDSGSFVSKTWIPDSTSKNFLDSGIRIPLHVVKIHFRSTIQTDASPASFPKRGKPLGNRVLSLSYFVHHKFDSLCLKCHSRLLTLGAKGFLFVSVEVANQAFHLQSAYKCAFDTKRERERKKLFNPGYTV